MPGCWAPTKTPSKCCELRSARPSAIVWTRVTSQAGLAATEPEPAPSGPSKISIRNRSDNVAHPSMRQDREKFPNYKTIRPTIQDKTIQDNLHALFPLVTVALGPHW